MVLYLESILDTTIPTYLYVSTESTESWAVGQISPGNNFATNLTATQLAAAVEAFNDSACHKVFIICGIVSYSVTALADSFLIIQETTDAFNVDFRYDQTGGQFTSEIPADGSASPDEGPFVRFGLLRQFHHHFRFLSERVNQKTEEALGKPIQTLKKAWAIVLSRRDFIKCHNLLLTEGL